MWSTRVCQCDEFVKGNDYLCAVCRLLPPAPVHLKPTPTPVAFKTGDSLTIAGTFKRRTFWQWLTRKPRELLTFTVVDNVTSEN